MRKKRMLEIEDAARVKKGENKKKGVLYSSGGERAIRLGRESLDRTGGPMLPR